MAKTLHLTNWHFYPPAASFNPHPWPLLVITLIAFIWLTTRLIQLTLISGSYYRQKAEANRIFTLPIIAQRGIIFDRNHQPLTQNIPEYRRQLPKTNPAEYKWEPINRDTALSLIIDPNETITYDNKRIYPCGLACSAVIGYVGNSGLKNEVVGIIGAEKAYDKELKGVMGEEYFEVNAKGKTTQTIGRKNPQSGADLHLTIDLSLQQFLYSLFDHQTGAAIALDAKNGDILALVSVPGYDPENIQAALTDPYLPLFNRAVSGVYPPGSIFKLITAVSGLEENQISINTQFEDTGEITVGEYTYGNWLFEEQGQTEGQIDLTKALARSNDIFFYQVGKLVGPNKMAEWANHFGLGKTYGLSFWEEAAGLIPTPKWKLAVKHEPWYLGNTFHMAIGQGDVLVTPLQVAGLTQALANKGILCPPHFYSNSKSSSCLQLNLNPPTVSLIKTGMVMACKSGGTAPAFFNSSVEVACKTGTAQQGGEKALPHGWFTMYAPANNPTFALTILVEEGGQGSQVAAPMAKKAVDFWFAVQR